MTNKQIEEAAVEARIASASTLTPRGTHTSIDGIPFVEGKFSYDEISEAAFVKGAEWRINSVWHKDKNDVPEEHRNVLIKILNDDVDVDYWVEQYNKRYHSTDNTGIDWDEVLMWAYIDDLIPTKG